MEREHIIKEKDIKRFFDKVEKTDTCWLWTGYIKPEGYGQFVLNGKTCRAHRIAYILKNGIIPDKTVLDHVCRKRSCVNPDHLEPVSQAENVKRGNAGKINNYQLNKEFCPKGHSYTGRTKSGYRICRRCRSDQQMAYKKALKSRQRDATI